MRIALVATPWYSVPPTGYGGIELVVAQLADGLVARGHDITLVTSGRLGTRAQHVLTSYDEPQTPRIGEALPEILHAAYTSAVLRDLDLDLVHDHSTAGPLLASGRACPTVVTAHNDVGGEYGGVLRLLGPSVVPVAISDAQRRCAPDLLWDAVVHNGIDVHDYGFRADKDDFVLFLGRISPNKAPHAAIDAARAAGRRIVLAAKCTEQVEKDYFEAQVRPRLGPDVEWLGEVDTQTKADLLSRASGLLFPIAWDEPFGLVMVEAMASGTPVVAMRRGAVSEVVAHGVTGWVCDSHDELVTGIGRLAELDPAACRRHVAEQFNPEQMVDRYERVYARALERPTVVDLPRAETGQTRRGTAPVRLSTAFIAR